jgi:hypothetical protein
MTLQDIFLNYPTKGTDPDYKGFQTTITIEGHPVWDYKEGIERGDIVLISEDPWEGVESEYVTTKELFDFVKDLDIPFEEITLYTEADYEQLKTFTWLQGTLVLSHY